MRLAHWQDRLSRAIARAEAKSFRWGEHDCVIFALSCLEALVGYRLPSPRYSSLRQARRLVGKVGFPRLVQSHMARFERIPFCRRQSGDIVLIHSDETWNEALSVVDVCPSGVLMPRRPRGLARLEGARLAVASCWHIPE